MPAERVQGVDVAVLRRLARELPFDGWCFDAEFVCRALAMMAVEDVAELVYLDRDQDAFAADTFLEPFVVGFGKVGEHLVGQATASFARLSAIQAFRLRRWSP